MSNPFADENTPLDYGLFARDVKPTPRSEPSEDSGAVRYVAIMSVPNQYYISPILYRGTSQSVHWSKNRWEGGTKHSQEYFVEQMRSSNNGKGCFADLPLYAATLCTLYDSRDGLHGDVVEEMRQMFAKDFHEGTLASTRVDYRLLIDDLITHGHGSSGQIFKLAGLQFCSPVPTLAALFDVDDVQKLRSAMSWVAGLPIVHLPERWPKCQTEAPVWMRTTQRGIEVMVNGEKELCIARGAFLEKIASYDARVWGADPWA